MKKLLAVSAVIMCVLMTGCGDKQEHDDSSGGNMVGSLGIDDNIALKDMPYGSYLTELSPDYDENLSYKMCFDTRYFENTIDGDRTEIYRIHDFILAINTNDHELMESLFYPGYLEYISQKDGADSIDEYLDNLYMYTESCLGKGFEMYYINVSNCYKEDDETAVSYLQSTDTEIYEFDSSIADKVASKKVAEIGGDTLFRGNENFGIISDFMSPFILRIYEIDGTPYLFM